MVIEELLTLPAWVIYEGVHFELNIFINSSKEVRLTYIISHVDSDSPHRSQYDAFKTWHNKLRNAEDPPPERWLYLQEGIDSDATLIWAVRTCWHWLQERGLLAGVNGRPYG